MTRDAKIGLLLGLVFIFIIAFLLNGLPSLRESKNNNELTTNMVSSQGATPGLGAKERKAQEIVNRTERLTPVGPINKTVVDDTQSPDAADRDIRFEMLLPDSTKVVKNISLEKSDDEIEQGSGVGRNERESVAPAWPKTYIVQEDDNLASIAKKFYGPEEGNRRKNIAALFEANSKLLKSPDEIYIGQKLIIPALDSPTVKEKAATALPNSIFEPVKSIGQRHLPTNPASTAKTKQVSQYVVKEGDSLWKIAQEKLGDGSRYPEISKLNNNILTDENNLVVGMRLRLPAQ